MHVYTHRVPSTIVTTSPALSTSVEQEGRLKDEPHGWVFPSVSLHCRLAHSPEEEERCEYYAHCLCMFCPFPITLLTVVIRLTCIHHHHKDTPFPFLSAGGEIFKNLNMYDSYSAHTRTRSNINPNHHLSIQKKQP